MGTGTLKVLQVERHRNGVMGAPFYAVRFTEKSGKDARLMLGIVFDELKHCAVLAVAPLSDDAIGVTFGENSYRGDEYENWLHIQIEKFEDTRTPAKVTA